MSHWVSANSNGHAGLNPAYIFDRGDGAIRMKIDGSGGINPSGGILTALSQPAPGVNHLASGLPYTQQGEEAIYRWGVEYPSGLYVPAVGVWNICAEWHQEYYGTITCPQYPSSFQGVHCDGSLGSPGTSPRLCFQFRSGLNTAGPNITNKILIDERVDGTGAVKPLQYDHLYDNVARFVWEPGASGEFEWWVDGVLQYRNLAIATMHSYCDGNAYPDNFGLYNYRRADILDESSVDYHFAYIGPDLVSVGIT